MKYALHISLIIIVVLGIPATLFSQENQKHDCVFKTSSLHHTVNGMSYWYDKSQGGLESITGVPYSELNCNSCHVENCDVCHKIEKEGKTFYTNEAANNQDICLKCHAREAAIMKIDKKNNTQDVHFASGMQCLGKIKRIANRFMPYGKMDFIIRI